jgi:hypothetical protein
MMELVEGRAVGVGLPVDRLDVHRAVVLQHRIHEDVRLFGDRFGFVGGDLVGRGGDGCAEADDGHHEQAAWQSHRSPIAIDGRG